jgi:hypothetical protein
VACKYGPHPEDGQQECYNNECPDGYLCQGDNRCWLIGHEPSGTGGVIAAGLGGDPGTGGIVGYGGSRGTGGILGRGGATTTVVGTGGVHGTGGVAGSTGAGGAPPNAGTVVTIANYQAQGAMTGFGWIALGDLDSVSDPTCSSPAGPISNGVACDYTAWSSPTAYCMSGSLPALPPGAGQTDFDANWGIQIGINATPTPGGTLAQSFSGLTISVTGTPQTGLRAIAHRAGDGPKQTYCAPLNPGVPILFSSFNSQCWGGTSTVYLSAADVPYLDQLGVQVVSDTVPVKPKNLCVTGITFSR